MNLVHRLIDGINRDRKQIIVIGDALTDVWVHGQLDMTCQDGCPKFVETMRLRTQGGAANALQCLKNWGVSSYWSLYAWAENDRPVKTRFVAQDNKIVFRHDDEVEVIERNRDQYEWLRTDAIDAVKGAGAVLLSDYDKGFLTPTFIQEVATRCRDYGVPCVADCKRAPDVYEGCVLKGNVYWCFQHKPNLLTPKMVVTNGTDGPSVEGRMIDVNRSVVDCVNHVGAGDCFAAHLTLALAYGFYLREAAALAHSAGRVYVQRPHNAPPHPDEIMWDLSNVWHSPTST